MACLIGKEVIKKDVDVVDALKMSKGTFSAYKSGMNEPGKNFIPSFEELYKIKLADFDPEKITLEESDRLHTPKFTVNLNSPCYELEVENKFLKQRITDLEVTIQNKNEIILLQKKTVE